jgi:hypothetical protein
MPVLFVVFCAEVLCKPQKLTKHKIYVLKVCLQSGQFSFVSSELILDIFLYFPAAMPSYF